MPEHGSATSKSSLTAAVALCLAAPVLGTQPVGRSQVSWPSAMLTSNLTFQMWIMVRMKSDDRQQILRMLTLMSKGGHGVLFCGSLKLQSSPTRGRAGVSADRLPRRPLLARARGYRLTDKSMSTHEHGYRQRE
jgi:hypothetical protein